MIARADLTDLVKTAPAELAAIMNRASDALDMSDLEALAELLSQATRAGLTTWHRRVELMADDLAERGFGVPMDAHQGELL